MRHGPPARIFAAAWSLEREELDVNNESSEAIPFNDEDKGADAGKDDVAVATEDPLSSNFDTGMAAIFAACT